jgi:tetratricopeptide (TPR) repeat protein
MGTEFGDRSREFTDKAKDAFDLGLSKDPENHDLIAALHSLAAGRAVWTAESKPQEALRWANEAAMWAARRKGEARSSDFLVAEANRLTGHAAAMAASGDPQAGLAEMNQVVKLLEELTQDADNRSAVMNLVASLSNRALLEYDLDRKDDYLATCERAFALTEAQRQQGNFPPAMERQRFRLLNYLSWAYVEKRDPRAGSFVEMAYKELAQKAKADPQNLPSRSYLCDILINLKPPGFDRPEEGLQYAEQMIAIAPKGFGGYESAAFALERLNRFAEAADTLKKALAMLDAPAPGQPPSKIYSTISARVANYEALADKMGAAQPAR